MIFFESFLNIKADPEKYLHAAHDFGYTFHCGDFLLFLVVLITPLYRFCPRFSLKFV